jgi:hypothetical protein
MQPWEDELSRCESSRDKIVVRDRSRPSKKKQVQVWGGKRMEQAGQELVWMSRPRLAILGNRATDCVCRQQILEGT